MTDTHADFYVERGHEAEWIVSLAANADPPHLSTLERGQAVLAATNRSEYLQAVRELARQWEAEAQGVYRGLSYPEGTWRDESLLGYRYTFADEQVLIAKGTNPWWEPAATTVGWKSGQRQSCPPPVRHPDSGTSMPPPLDPSTTAQWAHYRLVRRSAQDVLSQCLQVPVDETVTAEWLQNHAASIGDRTAADGLIEAVKKLRKAVDHAKRHDITEALASVTAARARARDARTAIRASTTSEHPPG